MASALPLPKIDLAKWTNGTNPGQCRCLQDKGIFISATLTDPKTKETYNLCNHCLKEYLTMLEKLNTIERLTRIDNNLNTLVDMLARVDVMKSMQNLEKQVTEDAKEPKGLNS